MVESEKTKKLKSCFIYTAIFWLVAHGYRFANNLYTGDTLTNVFQDDIIWQRSLGRFMQPVNMIFRGVVVAPWLLFVLAIILFSLSTYLLSNILKIDNTFQLILLCGVLSCNAALTCANGVYTSWIDVYGLAYLLAVIGVWLLDKDKVWSYILGIIALVCCMGFYQAYIDVALGLVAIMLIMELTKKAIDKKTLIKYAKMFGGLLLSGVVYAVTYKLVMKIHHVEEALSYNSLSSVGDYQGVSIVGLIIDTYGKFIHYLFNQGTFVSTYLLGKSVSDVWNIIIIVFEISVFISIIAGLIIIDRKNKIPMWQIVIQMLGLIGLPFALNFVFILSKGMEYELMIYSFYLIYALFIVVFNQLLSDKKWKAWTKHLVMIPLMVFIWNNIVFSNQLYFKIDMMDRAALSISTRMINDIENTEGYEPGVTPVVIVGSLNYSSNYLPVIYLTDIKMHGNFNTPFNYVFSIPTYWQVYLDSNINLVNGPVDTEVVDRMPDYPEKGSIQYVGDVLVIKISKREYD